MTKWALVAWLVIANNLHITQVCVLITYHQLNRRPMDVNNTFIQVMLCFGGP